MAARIASLIKRCERLPAILALLLCLPFAALACAPTTSATVALGAVDGLRLVPTVIDGRRAILELDTGAERTLLTQTGFEALGLSLDQWTSSAMVGIGGVEQHRDASVGSVAVGDMTLARKLGPVRSLPVMTTIRGRAAGLEIDGLLGADLLSSHDVELRDRGATLVLHDAAGCAGRFVDWAEDVVPAAHPHIGLLVVPVRVGGVTLRGLIDTGSQLSIVARPVAARLGVDDRALAGAPAAEVLGLGRNTLALRQHDFGPVSIGRVTLDGLPLWVGTLPPAGFDMIVGMDRLASGRFWLSYATGQVFLARG